MAQSDKERISALEAQVVELSKLIPKNETKSAAPSPKPLDEEGVVRTFFPRTTSIEMPSSKQFEELFSIVERVRPGYYAGHHLANPLVGAASSTSSR